MIVVEGDVDVVRFFGESTHPLGYFVDLLVRVVILEALRDRSARDVGARISPMGTQVSELGTRNLIFCLHDGEVLAFGSVDQNQGQVSAPKELQGGVSMGFGE